MKKEFLLLGILLGLVLVSAQEQKPDNYNDYDSLTMKVRIASDITITPTETNHKVETLKALVSFFPKEDYRQTLIDTTLAADPEAEAQVMGKKNVIFEWMRPTEEKIMYTVDAIVQTKNTRIPIDRKIKFPILELEPELLRYTQPTEFIDLTQDIEEQAREIVGSETDTYKVLVKIAEWIRQNVEYDLSTLTADVVQKSSWVLEYRQGVCDELTNLFISMVRSIGIPARFVSGTVYSNLDYQWGPHGWAEVYLPGYDWVPFDVTFGQYGWISPSHVELKDDFDSGTPSVEYSWQSTGVDVKIEGIKIDTILQKTGAHVESPVTISVEPFRRSVGPGSYVPVLVTVQNNEPYYVSTSIIVKKAPPLTEKNTKEVLLGPEETKIVPWIVKIPESVEPGFIYTSTIEVSSSFNNAATSEIVYAQEYPVLKQIEAESIAYSHAEREEKNLFEGITIHCDKDQVLYYTNDNALITCQLTNKQEKPAQLNLCLKEECRSLLIQPREIKTEQFMIQVRESGRILAVVEDSEKVNYEYIDLNVIQLPEVLITDIKPREIEYGEDAVIKFTVTSKTRVLSLKIGIGTDEINFPSFEGSKDISIETNGRNMANGLTLHLSYTDEKRKLYERDEQVPVSVQNVPFYAKFFLWIIGVFSDAY